MKYIFKFTQQLFKCTHVTYVVSNPKPMEEPPRIPDMSIADPLRVVVHSLRTTRLKCCNDVTTDVSANRQ